jgi:hypothetical protein
MSSETSTEPRIPGDLPPSGSDALQPWQLFTLAGLVGATITVFLSRGQSPAGVILLSLTVFAAAAVGIAALRTFIPLTSKLLPESLQVLGGRTRAALEREKTLVLRSIKELEFDRAMGKVSEKDFGEMSARLRARATRLMRQIDAGAGYRQQIEKEIERRIGSAGSKEQDPAYVTKQDPAYVAKQDPADVAKQDSTAASDVADVGRVLPPPPPDHRETRRSASREGGSTPAAACASCGTSNDADARFCKNCGTNLRR